ncbi:unnamed protein product [Caretta caretta]
MEGESLRDGLKGGGWPAPPPCWFKGGGGFQAPTGILGCKMLAPFEHPPTHTPTPKELDAPSAWLSAPPWSWGGGGAEGISPPPAQGDSSGSPVLTQLARAGGSCAEAALPLRPASC